MTSRWHLAQVNIGRLVAPADDPQVAGFFQELDRINALAEASAGFVWRLKGDGNSATDLQPTPDPRLIVNMSVWADAESLFDYVYRSAHTPVMAQRRTWFDRFDGAYQALWWIPAGTTPSVDEAFARLWLLDRFGPSDRAFTFKLRYPVPDAPGAPIDMRPTHGAWVTPDTMSSSIPAPVDVAIKGLCPRCGSKTLFAGMTKFADRCTACGLDFTQFNVGDGPAAFLTLIVGGLLFGVAVTLQLTVEPPLWMLALILIPLAAVVVTGSLRVAKGALLAFEYRNSAREGRITDK